ASMLQDRDAQVQKWAVHQIRERHLTEAVGELVRLLPQFNPSLQEDVCAALGALGEPAAIPALAECLTVRRRGWRRTASYAEEVRVKAAQALRQFLPSPNAQKALASAQKDPSPLVRQA